MAIFIDTGAFVGARNADDEHHKTALKIIAQISEGVYGKAYTTDYIFDEAIILAIVRTKRHDIARDVGSLILEFPNLSFLFTPENIFRRAWEIHAQYDDIPLSFTDCSIIAWCQSLKIERIATFDKHFDGILTRVIP